MPFNIQFISKLLLSKSNLFPKVFQISGNITHSVYRNLFTKIISLSLLLKLVINSDILKNKLHGTSYPAYTPRTFFRFSRAPAATCIKGQGRRSEDHTSDLQSLMRIPYAVFFFNNNNNT